MGAPQLTDYHSGETIIRKGDHGDTFFMIKSGAVVCTDIISRGEPIDDLALGPGDFFGERALLMSEPRAANVLATSDTVRTCAPHRCHRSSSSVLNNQRVLCSHRSPPSLPRPFPQVTCMELDRQPFTQLLGSLHELLDQALAKRILKAIPALASLPDEHREAVVSVFKTVPFAAGETLATEVSGSTIHAGRAVFA